jgi:hypothetical protein
LIVICLGLDQLLELLALHGALAQGLGGQRDGVPVRLDADVELDADVDAHAVHRDHGAFALPVHLQAQGAQVHPGDVVHHRDPERAAVEDHTLAAESGAHEGHVLGRAHVELGEDQADQKQNDDCKSG